MGKSGEFWVRFAVVTLDFTTYRKKRKKNKRQQQNSKGGEAGLEDIIMTGTHNHNIDAKGRMNFPAKLREILGETFKICPSVGGNYISVYSEERYARISEELFRLPGSEGENFRRWFFALVSDAQPDKQGRILIKQELRDFARLDKDVVVVGAGNKAEIWDKVRWDGVNASFDPSSISALASLCL